MSASICESWIPEENVREEERNICEDAALSEDDSGSLSDSWTELDEILLKEVLVQAFLIKSALMVL